MTSKCVIVSLFSWGCVLLICGCRDADPRRTEAASTPGQETSRTDSRDAPGQARRTAPRRVRVAAASDLRFVMDELQQEFQRSEPEITLESTFGSSGNFFAQLANEAPFDLFLSADIDFPRRLAEQGQGLAETLFAYAEGELVLWVRAESGLEITTLGMDSLREESVRKIAIANPQHAPYGRAAAAALEHFGVAEVVRDRLVIADNVAQALQFVDSGAADLGIVAAALVGAPGVRDRGRTWAIPREAYPALIQGGVVLKWARDRDAALRFKDYLQGGGQTILARYGFRQPAEVR